MFGNERTKEELDIIKIQAETIHHLTHSGPHKVRLVLTQTSINNSKFIIMSLTLAANQKVLGTLGLVDQVTGAAVTGGFSGTGAVSDTPAAFTTSIDASGNVIVTAVAAGSGNVTATTTAAYTDSTGAAQSALLTVVVPITVTAVVTADAVSLVLNFGTPMAQ